MARVTIEDCLHHVPNRFDLVILASKRARQLLAGAEPLVPINDDKVTVLALREIASGLLDLEALAKDAPEKRKESEEDYVGSSLDIETRDLMAEEINLPGVSESKFSEDDDFEALLGVSSANDADSDSDSDSDGTDTQALAGEDYDDL